MLIERKRESVLTRRWSPLKGLYLRNCPAASPGGRYGQYGPVSCFKQQPSTSGGAIQGSISLPNIRGPHMIVLPTATAEIQHM